MGRSETLSPREVQQHYRENEEGDCEKRIRSWLLWRKFGRRNTRDWPKEIQCINLGPQMTLNLEKRERKQQNAIQGHGQLKDI